MPERKVKVQFPGVGLVDGYDVPIIETTERWTDIKLEDGSIIRIKPVVTGVTRLEGRYDPEGNPMYAVAAGHAVALGSIPEILRKPPQGPQGPKLN